MQGIGKRHRRGVTAVCLSTGLALVAALATAPTSLAAKDGTPNSKSCYPNREYVYSPGSTSVSSDGSGQFLESELEYGTDSWDHGAGSFDWSAKGSVTQTATNTSSPQPGKMSGSLSLNVQFDNGDVVTFTSRCVAEVQSTYEEDPANSPTGGIELEAEGTVRGFPAAPAPVTLNKRTVNSNGQNAVVTARLTPDGKAAFTVEIGSTCFEGSPNNETEIGFHNDPEDGSKFVLDAPNRDAGRWGFPNGYGPGNCAG